MPENNPLQTYFGVGVLMGHVSATDMLPLEGAGAVKACIDAAIQVDGAAMLVGWVFDPDQAVTDFVWMVPSNISHEESYAVYMLESDTDNVRLGRVSRPDVAVAMHAPQGMSDRLGFVLVFSGELSGGILALALKDGRYVVLPYEPVLENGAVSEGLKLCWGYAGSTVFSSALAALGEKHRLVGMLDDLAHQDTTPQQPIGNCDLAISVEGQFAIFGGWIGKRADDLEALQLTDGSRVIDMTSSVLRYHRPDLLRAYPWSDHEMLGFVSVVSLPPGAGLSFSIEAMCHDGRRQGFTARCDLISWRDLGPHLERHPALFGPILRLFNQLNAASVSSDVLDECRRVLCRHVFPSWARMLPVMVEHPGWALAAIDRVYPLGSEGMLLFGWMHFPGQPPDAITVHGDGCDEISVDGLLVPLVREDVYRRFSDRYPEVGRRKGFVCRVPIPTNPGDARVFCISFGKQGEVWLNLPTDRVLKIGIEQVKEILGLVFEPERMRHDLYGLFDKGLGRALEFVSSGLSSKGRIIHSRQFGKSIADPRTSVVVPILPQSPDVMRQQLAQFADDAEFEDVELIYVVCDPDTASGALDLAARYQWLFNIPFVVMWSEEKIRPSSANNVGVKAARAGHIVFLHADVIPQHPGWIGLLRETLESGPGVGVVAPLLQLPDGTTDNAGIYPRVGDALPGFVLRDSQDRGLPWAGPDDAIVRPMISVACIMVRRADCIDVGGFDEGYLPGDFEDLDLPLALRKRGKELYLNPRAKLWRVARSSQVYGSNDSVSWLMTLFNHWRHQEKIKHGAVADPLDWLPNQGASA